jgi:hypothetical protein
MIVGTRYSLRNAAVSTDIGRTPSPAAYIVKRRRAQMVSRVEPLRPEDLHVKGDRECRL